MYPVCWDLAPRLQDDLRNGTTGLLITSNYYVNFVSSIPMWEKWYELQEGWDQHGSNIFITDRPYR